MFDYCGTCDASDLRLLVVLFDWLWVWFVDFGLVFGFVTLC